MNRSKLLLCILLVCFAAAVTYAVVRTPRQKTVAQLTYRPGQSATPQRMAQVSSSRLPVAGQQTSTVADTSVKRNLFAPLASVIAGGSGKRSSRQSPLPPPPVAPPPPPTAQEIARQQLNSLRFVGTLTRQNLHVAFLVRGNEVQLVRIGDNLYGGYRVRAITPNSLTAQSADGTDSITLQLN